MLIVFTWNCISRVKSCLGKFRFSKKRIVWRFVVRSGQHVAAPELRGFSCTPASPLGDSIKFPRLAWSRPLCGSLGMPFSKALISYGATLRATNASAGVPIKYYGLSYSLALSPLLKDVRLTILLKFIPKILRWVNR